ncbi:MAG: hypothetical protein SOH58_00665 [Olsenella sp.]|jgi:hypothetical protein
MQGDDRREGPRATDEPRATGTSQTSPAAARRATGKPDATDAKAERPSPYASFIRAENEDDDGYDPYSDRPARPEPLFERDPWD